MLFSLNISVLLLLISSTSGRTTEQVPEIKVQIDFTLHLPPLLTLTIWQWHYKQSHTTYFPQKPTLWSLSNVVLLLLLVLLHYYSTSKQGWSKILPRLEQPYSPQKPTLWSLSNVVLLLVLVNKGETKFCPDKRNQKW